MWEHPFADCVCPLPFMGEMDLMWTPVMSFLRVYWPLSDRRVQLVLEKVKPVGDVM